MSKVSKVRRSRKSQRSRRSRKVRKSRKRLFGGILSLLGLRKKQPPPPSSGGPPAIRHLNRKRNRNSRKYRVMSSPVIEHYREQIDAANKLMDEMPYIYG